MFYPPDELQQRRWCDELNLRFVTPVAYGPGSPSTYLTVPNRTVNVPGDGNCLFSALSYIVTGSKRQHAQMRAIVVRNMPFFKNELMRNVINRSVYCNLDHYLSVTRMYCDCGYPVIQTLAALLNTTIYSYSETFRSWTRFGSYEKYGISSNTKCTRIIHKICWRQSFPSRQIYCIICIKLMARGWSGGYYYCNKIMLLMEEGGRREVH